MKLEIIYSQVSLPDCRTKQVVKKLRNFGEVQISIFRDVQKVKITTRKLCGAESLAKT